jgi:polygalacturonase
MAVKAVVSKSSRIIVVAVAALFLAACDGGNPSATTSVSQSIAASSRTALNADTLVDIDLAAVANVYAIANVGSPVINGGMDTDGYAYAANLLGSSVTWSGVSFTFGRAGVRSAVYGATIAVPAGQYSSLKLLGAAVQGSHVNQVIVVNYTDGSADTYKQSMSDWNSPQTYAGESKVLTLPYKVRGQGTTLNQVNYVNGYSFAVNGAKTLASITLPGNRDIVILAVALSSNSSVPTAAAPTFSPGPGTYGSAQTITLSDSTPGAAIYFTTNGATPTTSSARYSTPLNVSATTTLEAMAAAGGYANSAVTSATYTINASTGSVVDVDLAAAANVFAIANVGSAVISGGMDTYGYAYAANLLGSSITWSGVPFKFGRAGVRSAVYGGTIAVTTGHYSSLKLLGAAVQGNHVNQVIVVNYTDGSADTFKQSMSDWSSPQNYAGESKVLTLPYKVRGQGTTLNQVNYVYGYSFAVNSAKSVASITFPSNRDIVILAVALTPVTTTSACSPLAFGAVGDGSTDNTTAIQNAVNACAAQGGGNVELSVVGNNAVYVTGPFVLKSQVQLQIDSGVTLQATNDHSRYVGAYINWVYQPNEALISAEGADNVGIIGAGIIDGAGNELQPNGGPSWWTLGASQPTSTRPWLLEFYQCNHVTISGVTLKNSPMWNQALRFSNDITESGVTINAPANAPNTDGVDLVGSTNVTLSNLNISVGDDNIAIKSGLPIDPTDPKQKGLPQMATSQVQVTNIIAGEGHGISIGSEASNGVNNVTIQNVHFTYTGNGLRIKTGRDRGGQIYNIVAKELVMAGVAVPITINAYYPAAGGPSEPPYQPAAPITATTPYVHDITIDNVVATGAIAQSIIEGLPESCIHNVTLNSVSIQTSGTGINLRHMTGTLTNVTSTPAPPNPPFVVQENVTVATAGTTPAITNTLPKANQTACSAQIVPGSG